MTDCNCSKDSWGCEKCVSINETYEFYSNKSIEEDVEKCTCINCSCGKLKCWICGRGDAPIDYEPCILHDECIANLDGCYNTTINIIHENKTQTRIYIGPFEIYDTVGAVCPNCYQHPDFEDIFLNEMK